MGPENFFTCYFAPYNECGARNLHLTKLCNIVQCLHNDFIVFCSIHIEGENGKDAYK